MNLPAARLHSQFRVRSWQFPVPLRVASSSNDFCSRKCSAGKSHVRERSQSFATVQQYLLKVHNNMKS